MSWRDWWWWKQPRKGEIQLSNRGKIAEKMRKHISLIHYHPWTHDPLLFHWNSLNMPGISKYGYGKSFKDRHICGSRIFSSQSTIRNTRLSKSQVSVSPLFMIRRASSPTFPWKSVNWKQENPSIHSRTGRDAEEGRNVDTRYWFPIWCTHSAGNCSVHIYDWKLCKRCLCTRECFCSWNRTTSCGRRSTATMLPYQHSTATSFLFPPRCSCFICILFRKHYWNEASRVQKYVNLTIPEEDKAVVLKRFSHI